MGHIENLNPIRPSIIGVAQAVDRERVGPGNLRQRKTGRTGRTGRALAVHQATGVVHLDAGLTLNERAFRNFSAAEREVGFLGRSRLSCEVYPAHLTVPHVEFLQSVGCSYVGVGLQSYNQEVLKSVDRSAKPESFV